jgi:hypothetical protein
MNESHEMLHDRTPALERENIELRMQLHRLLRIEQAARDLLQWYDQFSETGGPVQRVEKLQNCLEA